MPYIQGLRIIQTLQPFKTKVIQQTGSRVCRSHSTVGTLQVESLAATNRRQLLQLNKEACRIVLPIMYTNKSPGQ